MNTKNILSLVVILVVGLGVGFTLGKNQSAPMMHHMSEDMSMTTMMDSMNANLAGKSGDEFDKAFIDDMIVHHQGAVDMAKLALTNAKHQEIKDLAAAIILAQNKEIEDMKSWKNSWYK